MPTKLADPPLPHASDLITITEALALVAEIRGKPVHLRTLRRWEEAGHLTFWTMGVKDVRVSKSQLTAFLTPRPSRASSTTTPAAAQRDHRHAVRELRKMGVMPKAS